VHLSETAGQRLVTGTRASFAWTSFHGKVTGIPKRGARTFDHCLLTERITVAGKFSETVLPTVAFQHCRIIGNLIVGELSGVAQVAIEESSVSGRLAFEDQCSAAMRIHGSSVRTFDSLGCAFAGEIDIFESVVENRISLARCTFGAPFSIVATDLRIAVELLDCDFEQRVTFADVAWPAPTVATVSGEGSKFLATASFVGTEPPPVRLFHGAEFASSVTFSAIPDKQLRATFLAELNCAEAKDTSHTLTVEDGCRTLRKLAESRGDVHQEFFWHRAEIVSRRVTGQSPFSERLFSRLYGLTANYGLSISRPFTALVILTAIFAALYAWVGGPSWVGSVDLKSIEEGLGFSLNRMFPIGVFGDEQNIWREHLLGSGGELHHIAIRTIATAQSVVSAVLIYLGVMAVRRKFRIS
jgi:hypothetical protein